MARLAIGLLATAVSEKYERQIEACLQTWMKIAASRQVPVKFLAGYILYPHPDYVNLPGVGEDYQSAFHKQFRGLAWLLANVPADFYYLAGTDTYVHVDRLLKALEPYQPEQLLYLGGHGWERNICGKQIYFHSGGAGFVLSRATLQKYVERFADWTADWQSKVPQLWPDAQYACDVALAYFLQEDGHPVQKHPGFYGCDWDGEVKGAKGFRCCPSVDRQNMVACHYMAPEQMQACQQEYYEPKNRDWTFVLWEPEGPLPELPGKLLVFLSQARFPELWRQQKEAGRLAQTYFLTLEPSEWPLAWAAEKLATLHPGLDLVRALRPTNQLGLFGRAIELNPFRTSHFAWLASSLALPGPELAAILGHFRERLSFRWQETPDLRFLTVGESHFQVVETLFNNRLRQTVEAGAVPSEELLGQIFRDKPELFDLYCGRAEEIFSAYLSGKNPAPYAQAVIPRVDEESDHRSNLEICQNLYQSHLSGRNPLASEDLFVLLREYIKATVFLGQDALPLAEAARQLVETDPLFRTRFQTEPLAFDFALRTGKPKVFLFPQKTLPEKQLQRLRKLYPDDALVVFQPEGQIGPEVIYRDGLVLRPAKCALNFEPRVRLRF